MWLALVRRTMEDRCNYWMVAGFLLFISSASVSTDGSVTAVIRCQGELVKTFTECYHLNADGIHNGCYYNNNARQYDSCQNVCDGKPANFINIAMCDGYCPGYRDQACKTYLPTTKPSTTSTTTAPSTPSTSSKPTSTSSARPSSSTGPSIFSTLAGITKPVSVDPERKKYKRNKKGLLAGLLVGGIVLISLILITLFRFYLKCRQDNRRCWICKERFYKCCFCWLAENCFCKQYAIAGLGNKAESETASTSLESEQSSTTSSVQVSTPEATADSFDRYSSSPLQARRLFQQPEAESETAPMTP